MFCFSITTVLSSESFNRQSDAGLRLKKKKKSRTNLWETSETDKPPESPARKHPDVVVSDDEH